MTDFEYSLQSSSLKIGQTLARHQRRLPAGTHFHLEELKKNWNRNSNFWGVSLALSSLFNWRCVYSVYVLLLSWSAKLDKDQFCSAWCYLSEKQFIRETNFSVECFCSHVKGCSKNDSGSGDKMSSRFQHRLSSILPQTVTILYFYFFTLFSSLPLQMKRCTKHGEFLSTATPVEQQQAHPSPSLQLSRYRTNKRTNGWTDGSRVPCRDV